MKKTITLALTGASGLPYGIGLLECLLAAVVDFIGARVLDRLGVERSLIERRGESGAEPGADRRRTAGGCAGKRIAPRWHAATPSRFRAR